MNENSFWYKIKPFVSSGILIWWGTMVVLLLNKNGVATAIPEHDYNIVEVGQLLSEDFYSITFRGEKIGFSSVSKRKIPTGFLYQETSYYRLPVGGTVQEINSQGLISVDDSLHTKIVNFEFSSGGFNTQANAIFREKQIDVEIITPSGKNNSSYPISGAIYSTTVIPELLKQRRFTRAEIVLPTFDPMTLTKKEYRIRVVGRDRIERFGDSEVLVVKLIFGFLRSDMFLDTNGVLLMEKTQEGFMTVRENKEKAFDFDPKKSGNFDLLTAFAIPLGGAVIENPRNVTKLVVKIGSLSEELFDLNDFNQLWDNDNQTLTIVSNGLVTEDTSVLGYLKIIPVDTAETPDIQCNDRRIIAKAEEITKGKNTDLEKLNAINEYLFKISNIEIPNYMEKRVSAN